MSRLPWILRTSMAITISNYLGWETDDLLSAPVHSESCRLLHFLIFFSFFSLAMDSRMIYVIAGFNRLINSFSYL